MIRRPLLALLAMLWLAACAAAPAAAPGAEGPGADTPDESGGVTVYLTSNGWHSGIAVPRTALPPGLLPEAADFPGAAYLAFGWGDADYYPAPEAGLGVALAAALTPTPAVLHLSGLPAPPGEVYPQSEVLAFALAPRAFAALAAYLDASVARPEGGEKAGPVAPGLDRYSLFYPATGAFHLFNTCNTWTARGLAAAGLPLHPTGVVTAEDLMRQARPLAR